MARFQWKSRLQKNLQQSNLFVTSNQLSFQHGKYSLHSERQSSHKSKCQSWYSSWLAWQLEQMPSEFFDVLNCEDMKHGHTKWLEQFEGAFFKIAEYLVTKESITFDELMTLLCKDGIIRELSHGDKYHMSAFYLILCIVGWQTMLFKPKCIDSMHFEIQDEQVGYRGDAYMCLKLEVASCT